MYSRLSLATCNNSKYFKAVCDKDLRHENTTCSVCLKYPVLSHDTDLGRQALGIEKVECNGSLELDQDSV